MVKVDRDEVGKPPEADRTALDPEARRPVDGGDIQQGPTRASSAVGDGPAHLMSNPLNVFDPAKVFRRCDPAVEIGPDRDRNARVAHRGEVADSIAEISLGVRTETDPRPGGGEVAKILGSRVRAMNRGGPLIDHPVFQREPHRRPTVARPAIVDLLNDLFEVKMKRGSASCGFGMDGGDAIDRNRSRGMRYRGHRLQRTFGDLLHPIETGQVMLEPSSVEAKLPSIQRTIVESTANIVTVKEHDSNAGIPSRPKDGVVEHPTRCFVFVVGVMDVVKLTDGGDARIKHLLEGESARAIRPLDIERRDQLVHGRPPGEERSLAFEEGLTQPSHPTLEGMAVRVDEPRQKCDGPIRGTGGRPNLGDAISRNDDLMIRFEAPIRPQKRGANQGPGSRGFGG